MYSTIHLCFQVLLDQGSKMHRGIGFITFENADSVENLMADTHELGGSNVVVDRATPKARYSITDLYF
ncbi:putative nucleotide-binding alpha-beta plait domain-containing protein [Rosa chinensis]|uniref:Putative nucleotide-binding alpha-beta plait domain-containing protein n=1 Tax=Rosa chinensis TaxID=74649 RepID=A0A2P6QDK7_ROSCH|nr:putative nucleotide-binding alpha-beta plait domain-containing protein [Rosa chinensis]